MRLEHIIAMIFIGAACSAPSTDDGVDVETDNPVYQAECRIDCDGEADSCEASGTSCGVCGDPCDVGGRRGACTACCEGGSDVLRCRPLE